VIVWSAGSLGLQAALDAAQADSERTRDASRG
jgi:hypothetical protein